MAHKVTEFGEFKGKVTVEHEDGTVFHIEKEQFLLIEAIAKKICKEEFDGREKELERRIRKICSGNAGDGGRKQRPAGKSGVRKVGSENGKDVS